MLLFSESEVDHCRKSEDENGKGRRERFEDFWNPLVCVCLCAGRLICS